MTSQYQLGPFNRMQFWWTRTVEPTLEPITLAEAKQHARIVQDNDDATLVRYIQAAREAAEEYLGRGLYTQTWKLTLDFFPSDDQIFLPRAAPLQSVSSVKYYDNNGALQTLSTSIYDVDTVSRPGRITRAANQVWPSTQADRNLGRVEILYVVGWTTTAAIPERIKQGIRMYVTYLDADRSGFEPQNDKARQAAEACWSDRIEWVDPVCVYATW